MYKKIIAVLAAIAVLVPVGVQAGGTFPFMLSNDKLFIGQIQADKPFYKYDGTNYVPLRFISESLGLNVGYDSGKITIDKGKPDIEKLKQSCVMVQTDKGSGSGVVIDYGKVLTCHHVMEGQHINRVTWNDGKQEDNLSIAKDAESVDAAVLKSKNKDIKPVKIGDSDELKVGDKVYVVSCPKAVRNVVTEGRVIQSGSREITFKDSSKLYVDIIDAHAELGSSGGAVFDSSGSLIGIIEGDNAIVKNAFSIPIDDIRKAISD